VPEHRPAVTVDPFVVGAAVGDALQCSLDPITGVREGLVELEGTGNAAHGRTKVQVEKEKAEGDPPAFGP
jgi:hypothetical protein